MAFKKGWRKICGETNVLHYYVGNHPFCGSKIDKKSEQQKTDKKIYCQRCIRTLRSALNKANALK